MTLAGRRIAIILVLVTLVLGAAVAAVVASRASQPPPSFAPMTATPVAVPRDVTVTAHRGFSVLPGEPAEPPGRQLQSRLWAIDGRWFAAMIEPASRETRIFQLSADGSTWSDTGVLLDERPGVTVDALWSGEHLYVASVVPGRSRDDGVRVTRFSLDAAGRFGLDPDFPVTLTEPGAEAVSIARDSTGRLWTTFLAEGRLMVAWSTVNEVIWSAPTPFDGAPGPLDENDAAAVVTVGEGSVGLVWSDRNASEIRFSIRQDADEPEAWSEPEVAFDGLPLGELPIAVAAGPDGTTWVGVETAVADDPEAVGSEPGAVALVRTAEGAWSSTLIAYVEERFGQPVPLVDPAGRRAFVVGVHPRHGGAVHLKQASFDRLEFETGRGLPLIADARDPDLAHVTSTKQPVSLEEGFVVLAFDEETGTYSHAIVSAAPPGSASPGPSGAASPDGSGGASPAPAVARTLIVNHDFEAYPVGDPIRGWRLGPAEATGSLVAVRSTDGVAARLVPSGAAALRACRPFGVVSAGVVAADVRFRFDAVSPADVLITSLRDGGEEVASVRAGANGMFAWYDGATKVRSAIPARPGAWYRSSVGVDIAARRYSWRLVDDAGRTVVEVSGLTFRDPLAGPVSEVCVGTSSDAAGRGVEFDDVRLSR